MVLKAFDKCFLGINQTSVTSIVNWLNETDKIVAEDYSEIVLGLELERLAANYTFSETDKSRFNEINKLTSEVNKEVAAEMRKQ